MCVSCNENIIAEPSVRCIVCEQPTGTYLCKRHTATLQQGWYVAQRQGALQNLIDAYKFENARAASDSLADMLHARLPDLPEDTIIVPIPTISSHIRQRGYDHTLLIARSLARQRGFAVSSLLRRRTNSKQRDETRRQREQQAKEAFYVKGVVDDTRPYLLIDDIATTGATLRHAARELREAGASTVWVAVIARQPLD
jgi:ComF family protein